MGFTGLQVHYNIVFIKHDHILALGVLINDNFS